MPQSKLLSYFGKKWKKPDAASSQPPSPPSTVRKQNLEINKVGCELPTSSSSIFSSAIFTNDQTTHQQAPTVSNLCEIEIVKVVKHITDTTNVYEGHELSASPSTSTCQNFFDNITAPYQPHLESYNARMIAGKNEASTLITLNTSDSSRIPSCFCFPCHVFLPDYLTENIYENWLQRLEACSGVGERGD